MSKNLFVESLAGLTLRDIEEFLALDQPADLRPKEGDRLDYKGDLIPDLAEWIAAFANASGGLMFIGVDEDNGAPSALPGIERGRTDLKTRITSMILSVLQPLPRFEVCVVERDPTRDLALVRVETGTWPPYAFSSGGNTRFPIRVGDRKSTCSLRDIESLFVRRTLGDPVVRPFEAGDLYPERGGARSPTHLTVWVRPAVPDTLILDSSLEQKVTTALVGAGVRSGAEGLRRHNFFELEIAAPSNDVVQRWRFCHDGSLGFTVDLCGRSSTVVHVLDLATRLRSTLGGAEAVMHALGYVARIHVRATVGLGDVLLAVANADSVTVPHGVRLPENPKSPVIFELPTDRIVDLTELSEPSGLVATLLNEQLRALRSASVDIKLFAEWLAAYWRKTGDVP